MGFLEFNPGSHLMLCGRFVAGPHIRKMNVTFHLGGEEISVIHVDPAHTDGDSFVFFHKANVLHMGDCYLNGSFPVIDYSNGGSFTGIIGAADTALGILNDRSRIIPGHGPLARDHDLRDWRSMLTTIHDRVKKAVASGMNLEQIKAQRPTMEWDSRFPRSFVTSDHVVEEAYRAVTSQAPKNKAVTTSSTPELDNRRLVRKSRMACGH